MKECCYFILKWRINRTSILLRLLCNEPKQYSSPEYRWRIFWGSVSLWFLYSNGNRIQFCPSIHTEKADTFENCLKHGSKYTVLLYRYLLYMEPFFTFLRQLKHGKFFSCMIDNNIHQMRPNQKLTQGAQQLIDATYLHKIEHVVIRFLIFSRNARCT